MSKDKYLMNNWKPTEDIGIIIDDNTSKKRTTKELNDMIEKIRDVASDYGFDLNMWNHGNFIGFKKTNEIVESIIDK